MTEQVFVMAVLHFLNIPYRWGGDDPIKGLDCSGLVQECLAMLNLDPAGDQTAQGLYDYFLNFSDTGKDGPRLGSLAFYGKSIHEITHVAMFIDDKTIIEAGGGGSRVTNIDEAANFNAFIRLRYYKRRADLVAVLNPLGMPW